ncbi:hypothetical protein [Myxococcus sp. Y35]|uniref:hypothetical protein n=1 Tax=Pseudomyxococcus flavus TaxID=3115648 RepID=UPI003CF1B92F
MTCETTAQHIAKGHEEIDRLEKAGDVAALARIARRVAPLIAVGESHGWNGVENAKDLATFLKDELGALVKLRAGTTPAPPPDMWPTLTAFTLEMRRLLDKHRPRKGGREGWVRDAPATLLRRVREEANELANALATGATPAVVMAEAADVANLAMMVADAYAHQRARMTPTPAVPALIEGPIDEPSATLELHAEHCTPDECRYGEGQACTMWHDPALEGMPPQRVPVMLQDKVRMLADGTPQILVAGVWSPWLSREATALAQALADALRLLDVSARALSQAVLHAAQLGAEDMREQAATDLEEQWIVKDDAEQRLKDSLVQGLRALPLLGKAVRRG